MGLAGKLAERLRMLRWKRRQHDSLALRAWFRDRYRIDVGLHSYGCFDQWRMPGPIRVGRYCSIAGTVRSAPINHPYEAMTTHPVLYERKFGAVDENIHWDAPLVIEDDVWIGHNVMILPGCKFIGRGAIVGAGAIVTRDVAPYTVVAGNPARPLRARFAPDLVAALEESCWWELEPADLRGLIARDHALVYHPTAEAVRAWTAARKAGQ